MFTELINWFTEPFSHFIMQRALLTAIMVGGICAILSCYLVLKGWSLMGDAISHAVLPGIVIAYIVGFPFIIGAFVSGLLCALLTGFIKEHSRIKEDSVMGIVFSGMFAFGMLLYVEVRPDKHLDHIILGDLMGVRATDFLQLSVIAIIVLFIFLFKWKDFLLYCFDVSHARVAGLNVKLLNYGLLSLLTLAIVSSLQAVGVVMVIAMLIAPGITAFLVTKRFSMMIFIALAVSISSCIMGTLFSYHLNATTSACIVLFQSAIFCTVLFLTNIKRMFNKVTT